MDLIPQLQGVKRAGDGWTARCPAHQDKTSSLSVAHRDGKWLLKCHAGCDWKAIVAALGIEASDLFDDDSRRVSVFPPIRRARQAIASRDAELLRSRAAGSQTKRTPLGGNEIADAAERIVELLELVADAKRAAEAATEPQEQRRKRNKVRALLQELQALRCRLADEFGSHFGWVRARTGFTLQDLGRKPTYRYDTQAFDDDVVGYPTCFREPVRPYRPAAIAAHNHGPWLSDPADLAPLHYAAKLKDYASTFDLEATIVTDFPSWYWPGETMLVLYRPLPTIRSIRREEDVAEALEKHEPAEVDA